MILNLEKQQNETVFYFYDLLSGEILIVMLE